MFFYAAAIDECAATLKSLDFLAAPVRVLCSVNLNLGLRGKLKSIADLNAKLAES
jgi:hypothetical protein